MNAKSFDEYLDHRIEIKRVTRWVMFAMVMIIAVTFVYRDVTGQIDRTTEISVGIGILLLLLLTYLEFSEYTRLLRARRMNKAIDAFVAGSKPTN